MDRYVGRLPVITGSTEGDEIILKKSSVDQMQAVLTALTFEGMESYRGLLAALHHSLLFTLLWWSNSCSSKHQWFADSYETRVDGKNGSF